MKTRIISLLFAVLIFSGIQSAYATDPDKDTNKKASILNAEDPQMAINSYNYNTAIGIRGIGTSGLTIKHFNNSNHAIEGIVGFGPGAFSVTALWETYVSAFNEPGLNWYYGVGGHIATQTDWVYRDGWRYYRRSQGDLGFGIDGIFGMEYKINEVPIAVSLDVKPFLEVTTFGDAYLALDPGLGVKFTF